QQAQDKGIIGEEVWQSVIESVSQYMEQDSLGCFVGGTRIQIDNEDKVIPIEKVQLGDKVLSKPENDMGEPTYQTVAQTFIHHDKPIWLVETTKLIQLEDQQGNMLDYKQYKSASREIEFLVTPNHPIWIIGLLQDNVVVFYEQPQWKRVDELQRYEVVVNQHGVMYSVQRAQPVYKYQAVGEAEVNPDLYWYQKYYYEDYEQDYLYGDMKPDFDITEADYKSIGYVFDVTNYEQKGLKGVYIDECTNILKNSDNQYIPFTRTVYNLEVADYHTYYIGITGLWVHNTDCENKTTKALAGKETVDILLEYQDILREAATGQVTKSVYANLPKDKEAQKLKQAEIKVIEDELK
ncbi:hypothetical protein LVY74_17580, partial [Acinetobacter sp. ME22]|nr:hypothetical protein [Acinetobacter sp. ME22]